MEIFSFLGGMFAFLGVILIIIFGIAITMYILWAKAESKVLKMFGYEQTWMAWVPILNIIALSQITGDKDGNTKVCGLTIPTNVFSFWILIQLAISAIPIIGGLLSTAMNVICLGTCCIAAYSYCENKNPKDVAVIGYVSGLIPLIALIKFLGYKPNQNNMSGQYYNPTGQYNANMHNSDVNMGQYQQNQQYQNPNIQYSNPYQQPQNMGQNPNPNIQYQNGVIGNPVNPIPPVTPNQPTPTNNDRQWFDMDGNGH